MSGFTIIAPFFSVKNLMPLDWQAVTTAHRVSGRSPLGKTAHVVHGLGSLHMEITLRLHHQ
jgi:hypothetical protein